MKFILTIREKGQTETWEEHCNRPNVETLQDAEAYGRRIVENWNESLRPNEKAREFVSAAEGGNAEKVPKHICPECDGTGMADPDCEECGGDGWVEDTSDGGTMTCPACHGEQCPHCE